MTCRVPKTDTINVLGRNQCLEYRKIPLPTSHSVIFEFFEILVTVMNCHKIQNGQIFASMFANRENLSPESCLFCLKRSFTQSQQSKCCNKDTFAANRSQIRHQQFRFNRNRLLHRQKSLKQSKSCFQSRAGAGSTNVLERSTTTPSRDKVNAHA